MIRGRATSLALMALLLAGCSTSVDPEPTDSEPLPSLAGEWTVQREVTEVSGDAAETVGTVGTLALLFTDEHCTPTECQGTVISSLTIEDREHSAATGDYVSTRDGVVYEFAEAISPCVADSDGAVIVVDGYGNRVSYTATFTDTAPGRALAFRATGDRVLRTLPAAQDSGVCRPGDGEVGYELTATRVD